MRGRSWVVVFAMLLMSLPLHAITTKNLDQGVTATQVATLLTGTGATITNVRIIGSNLAVGSFKDADALGVATGVVLSTGNIGDAVGPNNAGDTGAGLGTDGHPALDALVKPFVTHDAAVLEFDVVTESPTFAIRYVFASEEYREWVDSEFNDVFAFFVDGANIALTPGSAEPVTVNTINHLRNQGLYRDNEGGTATQFDGYTTPLLAVAVVQPGVAHHIRIAIADASDSALDSAVFIAQGGISGSLLAPIIVPTRDVAEAKFGEGLVIPLALYYAFANNPPSLSATGIPDATFTFGPLYQPAPGMPLHSDMTVNLGPNTPSGSHTVTIRAGVGAAESFATVIIVVDCQPPFLLGTGQPQTQLVDRGKTATLSVQAQGSGPARYQWYQGFPGMTRNPVTNGTGATLTTGAVNEMTPYWVRITNACGTYDSLAAYTIPR